MNNVSLIGRLTRDPELRFTSKGTPVARLSIAINARTAERERVDFIDVTAWGKIAQATADHMSKGRLIGVSGSLRQERWTTDSGQNRSKLTVSASAIQFLPAGGGNGQTAGTEDTPEPTTDEVPPADEAF